MTYGVKKNIILFIVIILIISSIILTLNTMYHALKIDSIWKLVPTYVLLGLTISKSAYDIINNYFPIPKFKLEVNQNDSSYNLSGILTVTNITKKQIEIINIQNDFYAFLPINRYIEANSISNLEIKLNLIEKNIDYSKFKSKEDLTFVLSYKTNDSKSIKQIKLKIKNLFT